MRVLFLSLLALGLLSTTPVVQGQGKYNKKVKIGGAAPVFKDLPGIDGKKHSLGDYSGKDILVLAFTCNHCPYSEDYEDRIVAFTKKYAGLDSKVGVVAISASVKEEDRLPEMVKRAKEKKFNFPYLHDETQNIGRAYGSVVTPEFFVLNKERKIIYMGAMDDNSDDTKVKVKYVEDAVAAGLKGQMPAVTETPPVGCLLEYEKVKK
jgi:peroxiredoxin